MSSKIVGWDLIIPQLAAFFAVLKRRPNSLTPFNIFVSGNPGTNKTEGFLHLCELLGLRAAIVDSSTLDDVAELAGVVNLQANRMSGEACIIEGDLLRRAEILILDEFLNVREHVLPQFRLLLQGLLVLMGKKYPMDTRAIIGTGNLSSDMLEGQAHTLDSPSADRFALIVRVPSLTEMKPDDVTAVLEGRGNGNFAAALLKAVNGIDERFDAAEMEFGSHATRYVHALVGAVAKTPFAFEGRRGKLLRMFVLAAIALCQAEPKRKLADTIYDVMHDCLTYHRLSGMDLDIPALKAHHATAIQAMGDASVETLIATEPTLTGKIALIVRHLNIVSVITKADVFGQVVSSGDVPLQIACLELATLPCFVGQQAELTALIKRTQLPLPQNGVPLATSQLARLASMTSSEVLAFEISEGDEPRMNDLLTQVREHLDHWGVGGK